MKHPLHACLLFLSFGIIIAACRRPDPIDNLPSEVNLSASVTYLNGEVAAYTQEFLFDTLNRVMTYGFVETVPSKSIENLVGFGFVPYETGSFELTSDYPPNEKVSASFSQTYDEDLDGYEYELIDAEDGFLEIESLDTVKMEVKGRFLARFKRTKRNFKFNLGLPKYLIFQGVFYETYTFK